MKSIATTSSLGFLLFLLVEPMRAGDPCGILPRAHKHVPCVRVPHCDRGRALVGNYSVSDGISGPAVQQTLVELCHDYEYLTVSYLAQDNNVYSNCTTCACHVWEEDALEFMVAAGNGDAINYTEIDVSPRGALWAGAIHNPTGLHPVNTTVLDCEESGIEHHAGFGDDGWWAELRVPLRLIRKRGTAPLPPRGHSSFLREWRANFYRTDRRRGAKDQEFSAWSPTFQRPADFHVPEFFGVMLLEEV